MIVYLLNHKILVTNAPEPSSELLRQIQDSMRCSVALGDNGIMGILSEVQKPVHFEICEIASPNNLDGRRRIASMWVSHVYPIGPELNFHEDDRQFLAGMRIDRVAIHDRNIVIPKIDDLLLSDVQGVGTPVVDLMIVDHRKTIVAYDDHGEARRSWIVLKPDAVDYVGQNVRIVDGRTPVLELHDCQFLTEDRLEFVGTRRSQETGTATEIPLSTGATINIADIRSLEHDLGVRSALGAETYTVCLRDGTRIQIDQEDYVTLERLISK